VPNGQTLDGFTLARQGGFLPSPEALSTCDPRSFLNRIVVDVATSSIAWTVCGWMTWSVLEVRAEVVEGRRPLAPEELGSILAALQAARIGAESPCPWPDIPTKTLDVQTDQALLLYVNDQSACFASVAGRTAVVNLDGLFAILDPLVPAYY
jgi:hypothetical protein